MTQEDDRAYLETLKKTIEATDNKFVKLKVLEIYNKNLAEYKEKYKPVESLVKELFG